MARRRKQTRDDFPSELLYTQGRLWVRPGPNDTARVGVNLPAISERVSNVYHIDLHPRGYLLAGKRFGAIDLDVMLLELSSPFSGRIARVNWEAVQDPLLIMTSPFKEGWLYDLTRVKPESLEALLDRDAFWSYIEFERLARRLGIKPVLGGGYRLEVGSPWMDDLRVTFGGLTVLTGNVLKLGRNPTFTPQWSAGERWKVEVKVVQPSAAMVPAEFAGPEEVTVVWLYEVMETNAYVAGEPCSVLKAIEVDGPPPQSYYRLTFAHSDFTLRQFEVVSVFDVNRRTQTPNDWGKETYLELREQHQILLDLPLFPAENRDEERKVEVEGEPEILQRVSFPDERTMRIGCETSFGAETLCSDQTWERGLPWWREAERRIGERMVMRARLLQEADA